MKAGEVARVMTQTLAPRMVLLPSVDDIRKQILADMKRHAKPNTIIIPVVRRGGRSNA